MKRREPKPKQCSRCAGVEITFANNARYEFCHEHLREIMGEINRMLGLVPPNTASKEMG